MPSTSAGFDQFLEDIAPFFYRRSLSYVDVGGFVGEMLEKLLASKLKVREAHLIEPNPDSLQTARKRLAPLFKGQSLNFHALAMGDQVGHVRMSAARSMSKVLAADPEADGSGETSTPSGDGAFDAECSTLDLLSSRFTDGRVSLLKIDVEGYEEHVIAGAAQLLQQQKVDVIYIEAGMNPQGTQQVYYRRIEDLLIARGYRLFKIYEQHHEWMEDSPLLRRVNLAFMSSSFAERNPYRLTLELNQLRDELEVAQSETRATRVEAAKDLAEAAARLDEVERQRAEAKRSTSSLLTALEQRLVQERQAAVLRQQIEAKTHSQAIQSLEQDRQAAKAKALALQEQLQRLLEQSQAAALEHESKSKADAKAIQSLTAELAASQRALASLKAEAVKDHERAQARLARQMAQARENETRLSESERALQLLLERERESAAQLRSHLASVNHRLADQEHRRHTTENSVREVFASLADVQRRALRTQSKVDDAENELARIQRRRAHRMARVAAARRGSLMGWLGMPLALWREYRAPREAKPGATARKQARALANALTFRADRSSLSLPLSIQMQAVLLPQMGSPSELWVQVLLPNTALAVTMDLRWRHADASPANQPLEIEAGAEAPYALDAGSSVQLRLHGSDAFRLLTVPGEHPPILLELRRVRGDMPVIKLEFRKPGRRAPVLPSPEVSLPLATGAESEDAVPPTTTTTIEPAAERYDSAELEKKLWGGYAERALPALEERKQRTDVSLKEREDAAWSLIRWHMVHGDLTQALENIRFTLELVALPHKRVALAQAQCLVSLGRLEDADAVIGRALQSWPEKKRDFLLYRSTVRRRIDLGRGVALDEAEARQLDAINEAFQRAGLALLEKRDREQPLALSNIIARAEPKQTDQTRMVSVIVPSFNAEASIEAVIDGLLRQTWRNLEVIVVDDCSSDGTCARVERLAAADPRVRLVRKQINEGAYPTRNAGARLARGHFITVHDSDDWSHPQKIETQIAWLDERPGAQAVLSHWVRVGDGLEITGPWVPRGTLVDVNFSSLLFERSLLDTLGLWDTVKISGDAEFVFRMTAMYGQDAIVRVPEKFLLSLSLIREDSLTRAKATHLRSLYYGLRWNYRDAYLHWCGQLKRGGDPLPVDPESGRRRFPVPIGIRPGRVEPQTAQLLVVADFAEPGEPFDRALSFIVAAGRGGQRVAAWHWRPYERPSRAPLQAAFYDACLTWGVMILSPGDQVEAETLVVSELGLLHHLITPAPTMKASQAIVLVDDLTHHGAGLQPELLAATALELFGTRPTWVASTPAAREAMLGDGRFGDSAVQVWHPLMSLPEPLPVAGSPGSARPAAIVGRIGSDDPADWPTDTETLQHAYPTHRGHSVHVLGSVAPVGRLMGSVPTGWHVLPESVGVSEFLDGIDFYIHQPAASEPTRGQRAALSAMAAGKVVVASPACESLFGPAAVYAQPAQVADVVESLWASATRYTAQAAAGRDFVGRHVNIDSFSDRLARLAPSVVPAAVAQQAAPSEQSQPA